MVSVKIVAIGLGFSQGILLKRRCRGARKRNGGFVVRGSSLRLWLRFAPRLPAVDASRHWFVLGVRLGARGTGRARGVNCASRHLFVCTVVAGAEGTEGRRSDVLVER